MSLVTLPSQKLKARQKLRLGGTIWKVDGSAEDGSTSDKYRIVGVTSGVIISVTDRKLFFVSCKHCNETNGAIAGDSANGQNNFTARQWSALIGFYGVETRKQVQKIWKKTEKARYGSEVRTIVVTIIKEHQVGVDRQSS